LAKVSDDNMKWAAQASSGKEFTNAPGESNNNIVFCRSRSFATIQQLHHHHHHHHLLEGRSGLLAAAQRRPRSMRLLASHRVLRGNLAFQGNFSPLSSGFPFEPLN
jgi:hypothetical protein